MERMTGLLDATVHMSAADFAGMTLDGGAGIDDPELLAILGHGDFVTRRDRHDRKQGALGLPALGTAAGMIVRGLRLDGNLYRILAALAHQRAAGEVLGRGL